jgi:hypothetical protein
VVYDAAATRSTAIRAREDEGSAGTPALPSSLARDDERRARDYRLVPPLPLVPLPPDDPAPESDDPVPEPVAPEPLPPDVEPLPLVPEPLPREPDPEVPELPPDPVVPPLPVPSVVDPLPVPCPAAPLDPVPPLAAEPLWPPCLRSPPCCCPQAITAAANAARTAHLLFSMMPFMHPPLEIGNL